MKPILAAGQAVLRLNEAKRWAAREARYLEAYPRLAHYPDSTKRMAAELGCHPDTINKLQRTTGKRLRDARTAYRLAAGKRPAPTKPATCLPWSILQLFDTLMAYFRPAAEESENEQEVLPPEAGRQAEKYNPVVGDSRSTWIAWRVFLAAAFGLPSAALQTDQGVDTSTSGTLMPAYPGVAGDVPRGCANLQPLSDPQAIFEACTGRQSWPTWQSKIVSLIVGRRGGKSYVTAIIGIYLALCRKYVLNLGTKGMVMILAKDKEQAGVIRSYVLAFLNTDPLRGFIAGDPTQKLIELTNGITIEIRAVSEAGTRGYTVVAVLADEIAFWPTDPNSARQDKKVLRALRPAMLGIKGSMIVMLSSPYARRGELFEARQKAWGVDDSRRYFVWQADTLSMYPSDDLDLLDEIREEYDDDVENAKAEYGAQFRSDLEPIFSKTAIEAVSIPGCIERGYQSVHVYRAFVDPSGGSSDSYVLAIAHDEERKIGDEEIRIPVLDKILEWPAKFDPEDVSRQVADACLSYHVTQVTGDAYAGEWPRAPLQKRGVTYAVSELTRSELYLALLPVVNSKRCEMLDAVHWRRMVNQMANLERRVGRSGRDSVDHPQGGHDDVANAVAGVLVTCGLVPAACGTLDIGVAREDTGARSWRL